jgi:16S rRNA processing protein RimM
MEFGARAAAGSAPPDLIELGAVRGAYGLDGWVRIAPRADGDVLLQTRQWWLLGSLSGTSASSSASTRSNNSAARLVEVVQARRHAGNIVAKWKGCEGKDSADAFKGILVGVSRAEFRPLGPGEYYWHDLIGVQVVNRAKENLGRVVALGEHGQGQWLEVVGGDERRMIPLAEQYVDAVDLGAGLVRVDWSKDW